MVHRPDVMDGLPAVRHNDQSSFSAKVIYQKLEEGVYGEGLVDIPDRVENCGGGRRDHASPRCNRVDRDPVCRQLTERRHGAPFPRTVPDCVHEENPHYITL